MTQQGTNASVVFHGKGGSNASKLMYAESADLFANAIKDNLKPGKYSLVDLGGHRGEFLAELLSKLPESYQFDSTIIDREDGIDPLVNSKKIVGDIGNTQIPDKSIDLVIMRYVLAWNSIENQKKILKEISRICKGVCIIQHQGADSTDPLPLQNASAKIFEGIVPKLKREEGFFTASNQVESWMAELGIKFEKIHERKIETLSEMFIEKFSLSEYDANIIKDTLNGCDYITQSAYILRF